jgi:hypothetical protein
MLCDIVVAAFFCPSVPIFKCVAWEAKVSGG